VTKLNDSIATGSLVFLDTAPVIYYIERDKTYFKPLEEFFGRVDRGDLTVATSAISLAECLYYPYKNNDSRLVRAFTRRLVTGQNVRFVPITADIANHSAQLRATHNLGFADAFQIATAIVAGCDIFLTNDKQLKRIQSLKILVLGDFT
jgi:predicted nucleic acid-binding protein